MSSSESESDSESGALRTEGAGAAPAQYQAGYNSYGRPSMAMGSASTLQQPQQQPQESSDGSSGEDSDDEPAVAVPVQPRGKTFRPPRGEGDSSSSSEDEGDLKPAASNVAPAPINPNPCPPRGKELRLMSNQDADSTSDDEPLTHLKSKSSGKKTAAPTKAASKTAATKAGAKRKAPPPNGGDSDSDEECIATIVESDAAVTAEVIPSNKKVKANDGTAKKRAPAKKPGPRKKPGPKKGTKKPSSALSSSALAMPEVSAETAAAASAARTKLQNAVAMLPHKVAETHVVRSFGRIKPEYGAGPFDALYSNPGAIYPVGFSCDRLEFSPVHGRIVRMRCDILDGSLLKEGRKGLKKVKSENGAGEPMLLDEKEDLGDGPVFRVTWGEGVEEDKPACPFDPYVAAAPLGGDVDTIAIPLSSKTGKPAGMPEVGLKVSVRVDKGKMYAGVITNVAPIEKRTKSKKATCNITIQYEDGVSEVAQFPDPDIILASGCPPVMTSDGVVTEMNGKPVRSVLAKTPLEAWGKTLLSLGLIDEIIYKAALKELESARQDGFSTDKSDADKKKKKKSKELDSPTRRSKRQSLEGDEDASADIAAGWTKKVRPRPSDPDKTDTYYFSPDGKQFRSRTQAMKAHEESASKGNAGNDGDASKGTDADGKPADKMDVDEGGKPTDKMDVDEGDKLAGKMDVVQGDKREEPSPEEVKLREKLAELRGKLEAAKKRSNKESVNLANARIAAISPFATNPFIFREDSTTETTWLASAVKKEKGTMPNRGNIRKIVTPATMMDKQDTFFLPKIERLVEGLPGSEFAPSYVFHANRDSTSTGTAWIHEAKLKHQKQLQKKQNRELRLKKQAEARAEKHLNEEQKKEQKRKRKEEELAENRRLREEKEEKKKKDRVEKRLTILNSQMDDRLFKESCTVRERNVMNFVRGLNKEFTRRKKAAELAATSQIDRSSASAPSVDASRILAPFHHTLPPLSRAYSAEVVRIWDFLHSFSQVFSADAESLPSLDALQDAFNCLKTSSSDPKARSAAAELLEGIAIELCNVISPSLTKTLSTSVLNVEAIGKNGTEGGPQEDEDVSCLPCTEWTWREVARMIIVNDALTDLGYSKQESANLTKGYRSGGHPNSREAKRWKKIEESPIVMMYHRLEHHANDDEQFRRRAVRAIFSTPCAPSCTVPSDWRFFLHNIKSRSSNSHRFIKSNVSKALAALKEDESEANKAQSSIADLEKCLSILDKSGHGSGSPGPELHKAKQLAVRVLDATIEKRPPSFSKEGQDVPQMHQSEPARQRMGFQKMYQMTAEQFKAIEQSKEEYMAAALRLKEELERKARDDANEEEDEDEEDEEAEGKSDKPDEKVDEANAMDTDDATDSGKPAATSAEKDDEAAASAEKPRATVDPQEALNLTGHPTMTDKDASIATEPAGDSFPEGWVSRRVPRAKNPSENRWDRFWFSPQLGLKFRSKADAMRFVGKVDAAQGDEAVAIMEYHGKKKPSNIVNKAASKPAAKAGQDEADAPQVDYEFTEDVPDAPDLLRRCLAVLRTVCASNSADQFIYPVDPQLYPGYYETVMNPTSLYDIGKALQGAGAKFAENHSDPEIEEAVATMGRQVRTIVENTLCVNSSNNIVNAAVEMLRLFERLFFDWVLAPSASRPAFEHLDDDRCIDHHESDANSMVLLCDACEGKYNMNRLKPALTHVPSGAWYCPRCVSGTSWLTVDPRLGRQVKRGSFKGTVQSCKFLFAEDGKPSIIYRIQAMDSGHIEYWGVEEVDELVLGESVEPLSCLQALAESPGYGFGRDSGVAGGALPMAVNPLVGDKAAEAALSSGVFQDTVSTCVSLAHPPEEFTGEEWSTLLMLLVTKCSQSDDLQELSSKLENDEGSKLSSDMMTFWRNRGAKNVIADNSDDDSVSSEEESPNAPEGASSGIPPVVESKAKKEEASQAKQGEPDTDIVMKSSAEDGDRSSNLEISFSSSTGVDEASSSTAPNAKDGPPKEAAVLTKEDIFRKKRESALLAKAKRERKREESLMGFYVGHRLKATAASFDEDIVSAVVRSTLCSQEEGLELSSVRCREMCHYCGLSDVALGSPLCRAPNEQEWKETFPHVVHDRTTYMIAEVPRTPSEDDDFPAFQDKAEPEKTTKHVSVRVRVGGELVSSKTKCFDNSAKHSDAAMHQFLPKNPRGFQSEIKFRHESNLTILTGSHTAHEACAIAAHRHRKEKLLAERIATRRANMTRKVALICGKSVPMGTDPFGRSYWVFSAEPNSLFVCQVESVGEGAAASPRNLWRRFDKPEEIASIMVCLGKIGPLTETMKDAFPEAAKLAKDRTWSTLLMGRSLHPKEDAKAPSSPSERKPMEEEKADDYGPPFVEDEDVLVESENGNILWDAVVVSASKDPDTDKVDGYFVHYKNWSSRFDQWVEVSRVVEPSKTNLEVQEEVMQDLAKVNDATPPVLEGLFAFQFLNAKKRARSDHPLKTDIFETAFARPSASPDEKLLGLLKGAILLIEAALPRGSIGPSFLGAWNPESAALWRNLVKDAEGPESLIKCVLLLEDAINPDWLHSQATQLYAALPTKWRAVGEASLSSIALRVSVLDRCLKYAQKRKKGSSLDNL